MSTEKNDALEWFHGLSKEEQMKLKQDFWQAGSVELNEEIIKAHFLSLGCSPLPLTQDKINILRQAFPLKVYWLAMANHWIGRGDVIIGDIYLSQVDCLRFEDNEVQGALSNEGVKPEGQSPLYVRWSTKRHPQEIESLKKGWIKDGCWDIESTKGFEDHKAELLAWREQYEKEQEKVYAEKAREALRKATNELDKNFQDDPARMIADRFPGPQNSRYKELMLYRQTVALESIARSLAELNRNGLTFNKAEY